MEYVQYAKLKSTSVSREAKNKTLESEIEKNEEDPCSTVQSFSQFIIFLSLCNHILSFSGANVFMSDFRVYLSKGTFEVKSRKGRTGQG